MEIGKRIAQLRKERNITTNKLADLSGISQSYLRDIELGNKKPTVEFLSYICDGLNVSLQSFFTEDQTEINPMLMDALRKLTQQEQLKLAEFLESVKSG